MLCRVVHCARSVLSNTKDELGFSWKFNCQTPGVWFTPLFIVLLFPYNSGHLSCISLLALFMSTSQSLVSLLSN